MRSGGVEGKKNTKKSLRNLFNYIVSSIYLFILIYIYLSVVIEISIVHITMNSAPNNLQFIQGVSDYIWFYWDILILVRIPLRALYRPRILSTQRKREIYKKKKKKSGGIRTPVYLKIQRLRLLDAPNRHPYQQATYQW